MRTGNMRKRIEMPPTPSTTSSSHSHLARNRIDLIHKMSSTSQSPSHSTDFGIFEADEQHPNNKKPLTCKMMFSDFIDPQGTFYISWLCLVSMAFLYNAWLIPLRSTFTTSIQTPENTNYWLVADFCADIIYLLDVVLIKHRIMFIDEGFWVYDRNMTRKNYMRKLRFKVISVVVFVSIRISLVMHANLPVYRKNLH